ncbi:MAG: beta-N-acetylhexosaminidase [Pseudomonadota bacterium]
MNTTLELSELNSKIGQLFMIGIPGTGMDMETEALIQDYNPGGVILFSRNITEPLQVARLCRDLQANAMSSNSTPLFLSVDQEGGRVARLREPFTAFPGNRAVGMHKNPLKEAERFGHTTAREMKAVGLNMDLAPVVDVQRGEPEKHLEGRMFSEDPDVTAALGGAVIRSLQEKGVMAVAKHFPGLGRSTLDPHFELPRIEIESEEMENVNLPPFRAAVAEGVSGVMTSHAVYPALDPERPATLSPPILTDLLRKRLQFDGLIITDDLEMGAIAKRWGVAGGAVEAFVAGADILLICKSQERFLESLDQLRTKILQGEIPSRRLNESCERIMKAKSRFLDNAARISLAKVKKIFNI